MSLFGGDNANGRPAKAPVFKKYQKQSSISMKRTLAKSGLPLAKRKLIESALYEKFKSGETVYNQTVVEAVGEALGYRVGKQVKKAFTPQVDDKTLKERVKRNLKYAMAQRAKEQAGETEPNRRTMSALSAEPRKDKRDEENRRCALRPGL